MNMDVTKLLSRAWQIIWQHKILWVFGFLAALGSGGGGGGNGGGSGGNGGGGGGGDFDFPPEVMRFFNQLADNLPTLMAVGVGLICLGLLISLGIFFLSAIGRGGLIGGIHIADTQNAVRFGEAWAEGQRTFGRIILIHLIKAVPGFIAALVAILLAAGGVMMAVSGGRQSFDTIGPMMAVGLLACFFPLICIVGLASLALNIALHFAPYAIVLEDKSMREAMRRSWEVLKNNATNAVTLGVILLAINIGIGIVSAIPAIFLVGGLGAAAYGWYTGAQGVALGGLAFFVVCCAIYTPLMWAVGGAFEAWATAAWTLAYKQFTGLNAAPAPVVAPQLDPPQL